MSGLDYTKKPEIRNIVQATGHVAIGPTHRGRLQKAFESLKDYLYFVAFLSRTRGEKWLIYICILFGITGFILSCITIWLIRMPASVLLNCG